MLICWQAFENDKSDPVAARGARKANSVWILTADALKHGVQSTTRYRKSGPAKKGGGSKGPAIQRQRSGAKGGRAARRAAHLRRHMETPPRTIPHVAEEYPHGFASPTISSPQDAWSNISASPATPTDRATISYSLPQQFDYDYSDASGKFEVDTSFEDHYLRQTLSQTVPEDAYEDFSRVYRSESN